MANEETRQDTERDAAVAAYDALLQSGLAQPTHDAIVEQQRTRELVFGGKPICDALRPCLLDGPTYAEVKRAAELVNRGLCTVVQATRSDARLREQLLPGPLVAALDAIDGDTPLPTVVGRFDGLFDPTGRIRFIEYNPMPAGIALVDELAEAFEAAPAMRAFVATHGASARALRPALRDALDKAAARAGAAGPLRLGVVGQSSKNAAELSKLLRYVAQAGAVVVPPPDIGAWSFDGHSLRAGTHAVDLVVFIHPDHVAALLDRAGPDFPIFRAVRAGAAHVLNGLYRTEVLYSKAMFAALSDPAHAIMFEPEVCEAIARHIPWTRVARAGPTTCAEGREVHLPELILERKDALVLKPARGFGGAGVQLGWRCTADEWRAALDVAIEGPAAFVVQERVPMRADAYPVLRDGQIETEQRFTDLNPYVWGDEVAIGCAVRACREPLLNLAQGGSIVPVFVLDGQPGI